MEFKKVDHTDNYHGIEVSDPYSWMEDMQSQEVKEFIKEENKYTEEYLTKIPFRNNINERLTELADFERYTFVTKAGDYYFYFKNDGLQNQDILYRQKGIEGEPEVFLDPNELSSEGTTAIIETSVSKDNKYLAYALSHDGSDWEEIHIKEIETGEKLNDCIKWVRYSFISWYKNGFFYNRYDEINGDIFKEKNESPKTLYHTAGTLQSEDKLIYEDKEDPEKSFGIYTTEDQTFLFRTEYIKEEDGNKLFYQDLKNPDNEFKAICDDYNFEWDLINTEGEFFYLKTNKDASHYKVIKYNSADGVVSDLIPESELVIDEVLITSEKILVKYIKDAYHVIYVYDLKGNFENEINLPGIGSVIFGKTKKHSKEIFFSFNSFAYPNTIFRYNFNEKSTSVFKKNEVHFDAESIQSEQIFFKSKDGTMIPMFLVYKKGMLQNGNNPALIYGYGGFNISQTPAFNSSRILFIENGGIFAVVCLRGGGEYGEDWHQAGMKLKKQNVFDDFISAAEYLIKNKYTSSEKLAAQGRSNGGLLIGAVINQRPDLFKVALPAVGVMDMLKFHKFTIGWSWTSDYGSSDDPVQFENLISISPLHNVRKLDYPATLITTSDHDDRVVPLHSYKYAATLQELNAGHNPVLLRVGTNSGHGMGIPVTKAINETADIWSFVFFNLGMKWE